MYTLSEVCKKLGLHSEIVQKMLEKGRFRDAYQTQNGEWLIPEYNFITTREHDEKTKKIMEQIDRKNRGGRDENEIPYVSAIQIVDYFEDITIDKVINWIKTGYLSGKEIAGEYLIPKEIFEYLIYKCNAASKEEEIKLLLASDF